MKIYTNTLDKGRIMGYAGHIWEILADRVIDVVKHMEFTIAQLGVLNMFMVLT